MFVYLDTTKMEAIIHIPDLNNSQTRKISEKVQMVQIKLSINSNTTRYQIKISEKVQMVQIKLSINSNTTRYQIKINA